MNKLPGAAGVAGPGATLRTNALKDGSLGPLATDWSPAD